MKKVNIVGFAKSIELLRGAGINMDPAKPKIYPDTRCSAAVADRAIEAGRSTFWADKLRKRHSKYCKLCAYENE